MKRISIAVLAIACAAVMTACGATSVPPPSQGSALNPPGSPAGSSSVPSPSAGRTPAAPAPAGQIDQCSLLTADEVETALGRKVMSSGADPSGQNRCLWTLEPAAENRTVGVTVYFDDPRAAANFARDTQGGTVVPGMGDAAAYNIRTGGDYVLNVLRGDDYFRLHASIGARPNGGSSDYSSFETIARQILERL